MEIWLDSCNHDAVKAACKFNIIYGVTTNPSLLATANKDPHYIIRGLLDIQNGPVAVQVCSTSSEEMIPSGLALNAISDRIIVKVPVTVEGLITMKALIQEHVPVMATAVFQPSQAILATVTGANYVAPYIGRMFDAGLDAYTTLQSMQTIYRQYASKTKILAAALRTPEQVISCAELGISAVTLKEALFKQLLSNDPHTLNCLETFTEDWNAREYQASSILTL